MSNAELISVRKRKVPTLYETDESKYAGPHRWQVQSWARWMRRGLRWHAYTRWSQAAFTEVSVTGLEHLEGLEGPCIFVGNHQSHLDTLLVMEALPEAIRSRLLFGAAQDRWFVKGRKKLVLKPWYQSLALGTFPILRGGGKRALSYASWLLEQDQHIFLFPEGTRSMNGQLGEFKHGVSLLAQQHQIPVVPLLLGGLRELQPKGQRSVTAGPASLQVLEPLRFDRDLPVQQATDALYESMNSAYLDMLGLAPIQPNKAA